MTLGGLIIHTLDRHKNNLAFRTAEHQVSADDREAGEGRRRRAGECTGRERERERGRETTSGSSEVRLWRREGG